MKPYGTVIVFEDITEKISLQQQLLTSEKLASIGLLSAGVAHEINTPLTGISSYVQMLQKKLTDTHYAQILGKIEAQTDRVGRIIKNLLNFARNPSDSSFHRVDLKESLEEIISLIDYKLKTMNIELELELASLPPVQAQGERLQQVFINIILNALDAMPEGGKLRIELFRAGREAAVSDHRHRGGDQARAPAARLRPLLHDQGRRQGNGARPVHQLRHHQGARGPDPGPERVREGFDLHRLHPLRPAPAPDGREPRDKEMTMDPKGLLHIIDDEPVIHDVLGQLLDVGGLRHRALHLGRRGPRQARRPDVRPDAPRPPHARHGRHRGPPAPQEDRPRGRGHHHHGLRLGRIGHRRHEDGGLRLHPEALQARRPPHDHRPGPRAQAAPGREHPAQGRAPAEVRVREHHREEQADAGRLRAHQGRRADPEHDPRPGRERHGEGARRPGHPRAQRAGRIPLRHRQQRVPAARPPREPPLRARQGRLHRGRDPQDRAVRGGRQGDASSSTRSPRSTSRPRPSSSGSCRKRSSCGWAARRPSRSMPASSPRRTRTSRSSSG